MNESEPRYLLRDAVYLRLRGWILTGVLAPGEKLRDLELSDRLEVSRTPVREALRRLEDEGLVESAASRWTRVTPLDPDSPRQLYPLVWALERFAVEAGQGIASERLDELRAANTEMAAALERGDARAALEADLRFHDVLVDAAANPELSRIVRELKGRTRRLELAYFGAAMIASESVEEHAAIVDALAAGEARAAGDAIQRNWERPLARLAEALPRQPRADGDGGMPAGRDDRDGPDRPASAASPPSPQTQAPASAEAERQLPPFRRITGARAFEEVVDQLTYVIRAGYYAPGEKLPTVSELAETLGVSRPTIGDAVRVLAQTGVVEARRGAEGGVLVRSWNVPMALQRFDAERSARELNEVVEARRPVETELALLAAARATATDFADMESAVALLRAAGDRDEILHAENLFHYLMGRAARSDLLARYQHEILEAKSSLIEAWNAPLDIEHLAALHDETLAALRSRDQETVRGAMDRHLRDMEDPVARLWPQRGGRRARGARRGGRRARGGGGGRAGGRGGGGRGGGRST